MSYLPPINLYNYYELFAYKDVSGEFNDFYYNDIPGWG